MPTHTELEQRKNAARRGRGNRGQTGSGGKTTGIQNALSRPSSKAAGSLSNRQSVLTSLLGQSGSSGGSFSRIVKKKRKKGGSIGGFDPSRPITR